MSAQLGSSHPDNTCARPLSLLTNPHPWLGSQLARAWQLLAAAGVGGVGGARAGGPVWKESPATSSLSQPIEQESKSPSSFCLEPILPPQSAGPQGGGGELHPSAGSQQDRKLSRKAGNKARPTGRGDCCQPGPCDTSPPIKMIRAGRSRTFIDLHKQHSSHRQQQSNTKP